MSALSDFSQWLHHTEWATALRESEIVFPALLVVHLIGLVLLVGTMFVVDLRLLGWRFTTVPVLPFIRKLLRVSWTGFTVLAISGAFLLAAEIGNLYANPFLRAKFVLLAVVGLNALFFHRFIASRLEGWTAGARLPAAAKVTASVSLVLWFVIIGVSRLIPFFDVH